MADEQGPKRTFPSDVALVRLTLMRELETINAYEEFAAKATSDDVRIFLEHLANDEKEHVAEATQLLRALDAVQERFFQQDVSVAHMKAGHADLPGGAQASPAAPGGAAAGRFGGLTVGSLKTRRD